jgi:hypothetical protein
MEQKAVLSGPQKWIGAHAGFRCLRRPDGNQIHGSCGEEERMTSIRRITELKRANVPFRIRLSNGREFAVESGGCVEISLSVHGGDSITVYNAIENLEYRIPVNSIVTISTSIQ